MTTVLINSGTYNTFHWETVNHFVFDQIYASSIVKPTDLVHVGLNNILKYTCKLNQMKDNITVHISAYDDVFAVIVFAFM